MRDCRERIAGCGVDFAKMCNDIVNIGPPELTSCGFRHDELRSISARGKIVSAGARLEVSETQYHALAVQP